MFSQFSQHHSVAETPPTSSSITWCRWLPLALPYPAPYPKLLPSRCWTSFPLIFCLLCNLCHFGHKASWSPGPLACFFFLFSSSLPLFLSPQPSSHGPIQSETPSGCAVLFSSIKLLNPSQGAVKSSFFHSDATQLPSDSNMQCSTRVPPPPLEGHCLKLEDLPISAAPSVGIKGLHNAWQ